MMMPLKENLHSEKASATHKTNKRLISRTYISKLVKIRKKKTTQQKRRQNMNMQFRKEEIQITINV